MKGWRTGQQKTDTGISKTCFSSSFPTKRQQFLSWDALFPLQKFLQPRFLQTLIWLHYPILSKGNGNALAMTHSNCGFPQPFPLVQGLWHLWTKSIFSFYMAFLNFFLYSKCFLCSESPTQSFSPYHCYLPLRACFTSRKPTFPSHSPYQRPWCIKSLHN